MEYIFIIIYIISLAIYFETDLIQVKIECMCIADFIIITSGARFPINVIATLVIDVVMVAWAIVLKKIFRGEDNKDMHIKDRNGNTMESSACSNKNGLQIIYKVDGDFNGDITGDNVTVVLLNGDINGNVNANNGEIFLAKGSINGNVKADKVLCPNNPNSLNKSNDSDEVTEATCKDRTCESCWYYTKGYRHDYCTIDKHKIVLGNKKSCPFYDDKGQTQKYHVDCKYFSNEHGTCFIYGDICPVRNIDSCTTSIRRTK